jgi:hypothetical protein
MEPSSPVLLRHGASSYTTLTELTLGLQQPLPQSLESAPPECATQVNLSAAVESSNPGQHQEQGEMAYQRVNPRAFTHGFQAMQVQNREIMTRAVVRHSHRSHEDYAIISVTPLLARPLQFGEIQEVLHEFFEDHRRIMVREVQPSHLGQTLVRFVYAHDRDMHVNTSPHAYGDILIHVVRHNQARSWRQINFNRECWLMLLVFTSRIMKIFKMLLPPLEKCCYGRTIEIISQDYLSKPE